jgi:hypothetical protein
VSLGVGLQNAKLKEMSCMDRYERKKRLFILLWTVLCSFVLWAMSLVDMQSFNIGSFLWFTIFLFGGGVAYHFFIDNAKIAN